MRRAHAVGRMSVRRFVAGGICAVMLAVAPMALSGCASGKASAASDALAASKAVTTAAPWETAVQYGTSREVGDSGKAAFTVCVRNETGHAIGELSASVAGSDDYTSYLGPEEAIESGALFAWNVADGGTKASGKHDVQLVLKDGTECALHDVPLTSAADLTMRYKNEVAYVTYADADGAKKSTYKAERKILDKEKAAARAKARAEAEAAAKAKAEAEARAAAEAQAEAAAAEQAAAAEESASTASDTSSDTTTSSAGSSGSSRKSSTKSSTSSSSKKSSSSSKKSSTSSKKPSSKKSSSQKKDSCLGDDIVLE